MKRDEIYVVVGDYGEGFYGVFKSISAARKIAREEGGNIYAYDLKGTADEEGILPHKKVK